MSESIRDDLAVLVSEYGKADAEVKRIKKICDDSKEQIKSMMEQIGEDNFTAGGFVVNRVVTEKETLNEAKLIPMLKQYWSEMHKDEPCPYIQTKEFINMDKLEGAIYSKELPQSILTQMNDCVEVTTTVALRCKKAKEAKDNGRDGE